MISETHRIIFVHIPKTAGSSIEIFFNEFPETDTEGVHHQHLSTKECLSVYGSQRWSNYYTFSFVRNPWDRMLSLFLWAHKEEFWYDWVQSSGASPQSREFRWGMHNGHPEVKEGWYLKLRDRFIDYVSSIKSTKSLAASDFIAENIDKGKWVASQCTWLQKKKNTIDLNFIGKMENIDEDFQKVLEDISQIKDGKRKLPHAKKLVNRPHYSRFYDKKTQNLIKKLYADDIEAFGYEFEEPPKEEIKPKQGSKKEHKAIEFLKKGL